MTDFRALCAELEEQLSSWYGVVVSSGIGNANLKSVHELLDRARASLAEDETKSLFSE